MVQTPAKPSTISGLIRPGVPIYRPATPGKGGGSASGRSPTALSNAGKRMLQEATRGAVRGVGGPVGRSVRCRCFCSLLCCHARAERPTIEGSAADARRIVP